MRVVATVGLCVAACGGPPTPEGKVIAPNVDAYDLVLDGTKLFWESGSRGGIYDLSIAPLDPSPTTLVAPDAALSSAATQPTSIAIANGTVYWTNINQATRAGGSVWSVGASGGTPTVINAGLDQPSQIAIIGTNVYYVDDNVLYVTPDQGGSTVRVAGDVFELHLVGMRAVWTTMSLPRKLVQLDLSASAATPQMLDTPVYPDSFTADANNIYLRSTGPNDLSVTITALPVAGGSASTLFHDFIDDGAAVPRIVLDGDMLYWNARTQVWRIGIDGAGLSRRVENDRNITAIAVSTDALYLATTRDDVPTPLGSCECPVIVKVSK